jgi:hypothetical protein
MAELVNHLSEGTKVQNAVATKLILEKVIFLPSLLIKII